MSKYTTELRYICEALFPPELVPENHETIINYGAIRIFDFDFPIFDDAYKHQLCVKIIRHFYTREICCETYGRWKLFLIEKMNRIMPYYNQLYLSERMKYDPLKDVDLTTEHKGNDNKDSKTTANGKGNAQSSNTRTDNLTETTSGKNTNRCSDTPQGSLQDLESNTYLTNATINDEESTRKNSGTVINESTSSSGYSNGETTSSKSIDEYTTHYFGKSASKTYASLIREYRQTLINIDAMVIEELEDLFMNIW